eukprot:138732-Pelagomonas_calceolata.AAC.2
MQRLVRITSSWVALVSGPKAQERQTSNLQRKRVCTGTCTGVLESLCNLVQLCRSLVEVDGTHELNKICEHNDFRANCA